MPFQPEESELLVSVSRLSLQAVDRLLGYVPASENLPAGEIGAVIRLISGALNRGVEGENGSNGQTG